MTLAIPCYPEERIRGLPVHWSTYGDRTILEFEVVFDAGMRREKLGFVFLNDENSETPYQMACEDHGIERVTILILGRILEYCPTSVESFILPLATDPTFHLDGLYILLRREPAAFLQLLHTKETTSTVANKTTRAAAAASKRKCDDDDNNNESHNSIVVQYAPNRGILFYSND